MRKLLHVILFLSINLLGCALFSADLPASEPAILIPCPLDSCQKVSIEFSLQGLNYAAAFTCYEWTAGELAWKWIGRMVGEFYFLHFPIIEFANRSFASVLKVNVIVFGNLSKVVQEITL